MGAAKIVEHLGEGLYSITRDYAGLDEQLAYLADLRAMLESTLPQWRNAVAQQWDEAQSARQTVNAMIEDWARGGFVEFADLPSERSTPSTADKQEVIRLVNEIRADNGLDPLTENAQLADAAQQHAEYMGQETVGHTGAGNTTPAQRIAAAGYDYGAAAENVAAGQSTPEQVVASWMASPGHRANILNPDLTEIGVGGGTGEDYGRTWVQNFGTPQ